MRQSHEREGAGDYVVLLHGGAKLNMSRNYRQLVPRGGDET